MRLYDADQQYVREITDPKELRRAEAIYKEELGLLMKQGLFTPGIDKVKNRQHLLEVQAILSIIKQKFKLISQNIQIR